MTGKSSILLVDDDPTVIAALGSMLRDVGQLRFATSGLDALRLARQTAPDLVILDIEMPSMGGFEVCRAMKESATLADIPIIFVTSHDSIEQEVTGLGLGAVDFISKPPRGPLVVARVQMHLRMKQMADALRRLAGTVGLTGLSNRRQFDDALHREWLRSQRASSPLSLLMIDIDHFKAFNDHHGHPAGDRCIRSVAEIVRQVVRRPADLPARYGGEEFAVLLPDTHGQGACCVAANLQQAIESAQLPHGASPLAGHVTLSVGVAAYDNTCGAWAARAGSSQNSFPQPRDPASDLVTTADQGLYAAKRAGRRQARFLPLDDMDCPDRAMKLNHGNNHPSGAFSEVGARRA